MVSKNKVVTKKDELFGDKEVKKLKIHPKQIEN